MPGGSGVFHPELPDPEHYDWPPAHPALTAFVQADPSWLGDVTNISEATDSPYYVALVPEVLAACLQWEISRCEATAHERAYPVAYCQVWAECRTLDAQGLLRFTAGLVPTTFHLLTLAAMAASDHA